MKALTRPLMKAFMRDLVEAFVRALMATLVGFSWWALVGALMGSRGELSCGLSWALVGSGKHS